MITRPITLCAALLFSELATANPNDPSTNPVVGVTQAVSTPLPPPAGSMVTAIFDKSIDSAPAAKLANYSLRQVAPELGGGTPGGTLEDLDGDADLDLVLAQADNIIAYQNVGSPTSPRYTGTPVTLGTVGFFVGTSLTEADWYVNVSFGDLNGDGIRDMICGEADQGQVTCFFRQNAATAWPTYGSQKRVLYSIGPYLNLIEISTSQSSWAFDLAVPSVAVEDLDQDGFADLVIGDPHEIWSQPSNILVYRGSGQFHTDGSPVFLQPAYLKAAGTNIVLEWTLLGATCPCFHDVEGDGDRDLIVSTSVGEIWIFKANGVNSDSGSDNFGLPLFLAGERLRDSADQPLELGWVSALSVRDYSGDGDKDLVIVSSGSNSLEQNRLRVLENTASNALKFRGKPLPLGLEGSAAELRSTYDSKAAYFDFDSDGKTDVLYAGQGYGLAVSYNLDTGDNHDPSFGTLIALPVSFETVEALDEGVPDIADFNGDGYLQPQVDGIVAGTQDDLVFLRYDGLSPAGLPRFDDPISILPAGFPVLHYIQPSVGDIDGDGLLDIALVSGGLYSGETRQLLLLKNTSEARFTLSASAAVQVDGQAITTTMFPEILDYNGDGKNDLLVADRSPSFNRRQIASGSVRFLRNEGGTGPGFSNQGICLTTASGQVATSSDASPRSADFNRDGKPDLLLCASNSSVKPFLNAATGAGISVSPGTASLQVGATLPESVLLTGAGKRLKLVFPLCNHAGTVVNFNDLYVGGERASVAEKQTSADLDSDWDGLWDQWEIEHFGNLAKNGTGDDDGDGLSNQQEFLNGISPAKQDSDNDGVADGAELAAGTRPDEADTDRDGLLDGEEVGLGQDPKGNANSAAGSSTLTFSYDDVNRLTGSVSPSGTVTYELDAEGNILGN